MSQNMNLISIPSTIPSWSWTLNNPQNARIDNAVLSPKGQPTIGLEPGNTTREIEFLGTPIKPGDHIVFKCFIKNQPSSMSPGSHGSRIGIDFYDATGRICGLNLNDGSNVMYDMNGNPLGGAGGGAWQHEKWVSWGTQTWTQVIIDVVVPQTVYADGYTATAPLGSAHTPSSIWAWADAMPHNDPALAWYGDPELYINPSTTPPPSGNNNIVAGLAIVTIIAGVAYVVTRQR